MGFTSGVYAASLARRPTASSVSGSSFSTGRSSIFHALVPAGFRRPLTLLFLLLGVGIQLGSED
jgi:hypothetical protein